MTSSQNEASVLSHDSDPKEKKLSNFMVTNIVMISIVGIISILLLMFGDFEGKNIRVFSTLILFGIFTLFVALDTRHPRNSFYMSTSQIGHIYMLCLSLILIWASLFSYRYSFFGEEEMLFNLFMLVFVIKAAIMLIQFISRYLYTNNKQLTNVTNVAIASFAVTAVMYSFPLALDSFVDFGDMYWRFAVSVLLFSGLIISILSLMVWFFKDKSELTKPSPSIVGSFGKSDSDYRDERPTPVTSRVVDDNRTAPTVERSEPVAPVDSPTVGKNPDFNPPNLSAQPWPVYPTGMPLPAKANGRPDFNALKEFAELCARSEDQWYS